MSFRTVNSTIIQLSTNHTFTRSLTYLVVPFLFDNLNTQFLFHLGSIYYLKPDNSTAKRKERRMNRYSRINSKSKSDSSDHLCFPISQTPPIISKPHEEKCKKKEFGEKSIHIHGSIHEEEKGRNEDGEMFGVILSRSRSVSSYKSTERNSSMKRSSSVSSAAGGGYCRIHHQNDHPISDVVHSRRHGKKDRGNILRACMRLLGF
ncbi:hypothetical protein HAX54_004312 [Datura stramonium]|uniref:Uncharacterized protein n=1 Tax=Datura stramonium TaxID=4076 RepID=A0ABS8T7V9_DATST|nr:hypothetical protein [Datura stramonium]